MLKIASLVAKARLVIPGAVFALATPATRRHLLDFLRTASDDRRQQSTETLQKPMRLFAGYWYGWQTTPGKNGVPHFAPIRICTAKLDLLEHTVVELTFLGLGHHRSAKPIQERLRILYPAHDYLVANLDARIGLERTAIVSNLTRAWLARCCPTIAIELGASVDRLGMQQALDSVLTTH